MFLLEEAEFENIRYFLLENYNIDIQPPDHILRPLIESGVRLVMSLNTWEKYIY